MALIGAGERGRAFSRALSGVGELALRAIVDPDRARARALASASGWVRSFGSIERLLAAGQVPDIAVLCAPSALHFELGAPLLRSGADLLVEAPLATTRGEAERLTELAERLGRALLCSSALGAAARSACIERAFGAPHGGRIELELARRRDARARWRGDPALAGGGVLMDLGPAALELAEQLAGPLQQIRVVDADRLQRAEVEDSVLLETAHRGGAIAAIHLTWNEGAARPRARCRGSQAELALAETDPDGRSALLRELLARRLERDAIFDEGARTLSWLHAAYRSRELGRWQHCT
ncbi:MAG TPA: Gfo/Idh/MocA family oxidoreductase [Myxococcota bacterium]|nr:Gfo/Idh/MocA family oxidoreductase [Myxococcota bacterium]